MAGKKNENTLTALQMPLPSGFKTSRATKVDWTGLNLRQTTDTGELSMERNISTVETPYLAPSEKRTLYQTGYAEPIGMFGFEDFLVVVYASGQKIKVAYITAAGTTYTGVLQDTLDGEGCGKDVPRQVVKFNVYQYDSLEKQGKYLYKLLIFPDRKSMDFTITADSGLITAEDVKKNPQAGAVGSILISDMANINRNVVSYRNTAEPFFPKEKDLEGKPIDKSKWYLNVYNNLCFRWESSTGDGTVEEGNGEWVGCVPYGFPKLNYVTVHLSRLFGVDDNNVYASGFNDYTNWDLDTAEDFNDAHAWTSAAQSNTKANGAFTGIYTFQNHVVCFKDDFMHELTNTKNPFRIQDVFAEGTIDQRTIQDVDGRLIFVSRDGVKVYTGGNPRMIGYKLNVDRYRHGVSGTDGRRYYLYCETEEKQRSLFVYDTWFDRWAQEDIGLDTQVTAFAHNRNGMYMLTKDGSILRMDTGEYDHRWSFETDLMLRQSAGIKHIQKLQLVADMESGAWLKLYLLYDGEEYDPERAHLVYDSTAKTTVLRKSNNAGGTHIPIRILPRRTASFGFKLRGEGYGFVRLHQLEMELTPGGELYV